jgi:uncharacterized delta-60 repeat protein/RHS repeat-associated protein
VANALITLSNGKVLAGGYSGNDFAVFKYNTDGSLDTSFGTGGKKIVDVGSSTVDKAYAMALQQDGKILVAGISGNDFAVIRLTSAGALDTSFNTTGKFVFHTTGSNVQELRASGVSYDNYLYVAGNDSTAGGYFLARITSAGGLDTTFNTGSSGSVARGGISYVGCGSCCGTSTYTPSAYALAFQDDGMVVVAGTATDTSTTVNTCHPSTMFAMRFKHQYTSGSILDSGPNSGAEKMIDFGAASSVFGQGYAVSINSSGKIYVAGDAFASVSGVGCNTSFAVSRLTSSGALDTTFDGDGKLTTTFTSGTDSAIHAAAILSNGKFIAAGSDVVTGGTPSDFALARYNAPAGLEERIYAVNDANYNITALTDTFGTVIERYLYDSYGKRSITDASYSSLGSSSYSFDFGFQGGQYVANAELMILRNRYLNTSIQRWMQVDALSGYADGMNLFEVMAADPTGLRDPYGALSGIWRMQPIGPPTFNEIQYFLDLLGSDDWHTRQYAEDWLKQLARPNSKEYWDAIRRWKGEQDPEVQTRLEQVQQLPIKSFNVYDLPATTGSIRSTVNLHLHSKGWARIILGQFRAWKAQFSPNNIYYRNGWQNDNAFAPVDSIREHVWLISSDSTILAVIGANQDGQVSSFGPVPQFPTQQIEAALRPKKCGDVTLTAIYSEQCGNTDPNVQYWDVPVKVVP